MHVKAHIRDDLQAGLTVALVTVPQCMGFAAIAGLPPAMGLYGAIVMGLVNGLISRSTKSIIGPAITTSSMVYGVLASVARNDAVHWPEIATLLALIVGGMTLVLATLRVGELVRFVSRSVLIGLTVGVGVLIFGAQLGPFLGVRIEREPRVGVLVFNTLARVQEATWPEIFMGTGTLLMVLIGQRLGRKFPASFVAIALAGGMTWLLERMGLGQPLALIEPVPHTLPRLAMPAYGGPFWTDLIFGASAICVVSIIQTLALSKAFASRAGLRIDARRELTALGLSNIAAGCCGGFPGAESISRSAINDMAGARTRWSGIICSVATALIVLVAAPLTQFVTRSAIAGLLMATAWSVVDWRDVRELWSHAGSDRIVLFTTLAGLMVLPIHWAVLIGLSVSIALFLRRVSRLNLVEMVSGRGGAFHEVPIDDTTGFSPIAMLQIEGPLFFAHADEVAQTLGMVFSRKPVVTILRMRRTRQIDYSVLAEMNRVVQAYQANGGELVICGLSPLMLETIQRSPLGRTMNPRLLLLTTRKVFGSAHAAIALAKEIAHSRAGGGRPLLRESLDSVAENEESLESAWTYEI